MGKKGTVGGQRVRIGVIFRRIRKLLSEYREGRATALAELKDVEGTDPFRILIGTILSQRTRDESTTLASERLFHVYDSPRKLAAADSRRVAELIKPVLFYNRKAASIIRVAQQLVDQYAGQVPANLDDLLSLPSVGRKTANIVLVYAFGRPAIPVDTHVHRISNRLGIVQTRTAEETEEELTRLIPQKYWLELNELFVRFGQTICTPIGPKCHACTLQAECVYFKTVVEPRQHGDHRSREASHGGRRALRVR